MQQIVRIKKRRFIQNEPRFHKKPCICFKTNMMDIIVLFGMFEDIFSVVCMFSIFFLKQLRVER